MAIELEPAIRPFDGDRLADFDFLRDATREVAERFDEKGDRPVAPLCAGDGKGVGALEFAEGDKGELPRPVCLPRAF